MTEAWKEIEGYEGYYEISSFGRVRSVTRETIRKSNFGKNDFTSTTKGRILKIKPNNQGYITCTLSRQGRLRAFLVHRLVAKAFIKKVNGKSCVNHINGNKASNNINNLEWCNPSENAIHAYSIGTRKPRQGEKAPFSKLLDSQAAEILLDKRKSSQIAKEYSVKYSTVYNIKKGNTFKPVFNQLLLCALIFLNYRQAEGLNN